MEIELVKKFDAYYGFMICPHCKCELAIVDYESRKCRCGIDWKLEMKAIGTKEGLQNDNAKN